MNAQIDLIVERGAEKTVLLKIKSGTSVRAESLTNLKRLAADVPNARPLCLYDGQKPQVVAGIDVLPWQRGIREHFA